jgi:hypothetical protein
LILLGEFNKTFNKSDLLPIGHSDIVEANYAIVHNINQNGRLILLARLQSPARETTAIVKGT